MNIWFGKGKSGPRRLGLEIVTLIPCLDIVESGPPSTYGGVTLLGLGCLSGKDNQFALVGFQPLHIESLALLAQVSPPVINDDANTACLLAVDACLLQLSESKSTTFADLAVVADSLATDSRAKECKWADAEL